MEKVQQVGCRRTETFDLLAVELANGGDDRLFALAAAADIQEAAESDLVLAVLVDVWDPQLRLPEKGVVSALEDLALFGDRRDDRLEDGASVGVAEGVGVDRFDELLAGSARQRSMRLRNGMVDTGSPSHSHRSAGARPHGSARLRVYAAWS